MAFSMWGAVPPPPAGYATAVHARPPVSSFVPSGYHPYRPNSPIKPNTWALPKGMSLGYDPSKGGYYARPGVAAPKAAAPVDPITRMLTMLQGQILSPAQQEAMANREAAAQVKVQQDMMDKEYARQRADALAQYQAQAMAGSAAAAMSGDLFNAVGGEYNSAAGEIKGLSHGLTGAAGKTTAGEVSAANQGLGQYGNAPVTEGGVFGVGGSTQQGVEDYRAGTLGGQLFSSLGQAANFGLAGLASSDNLRATQEADAALMVSMHDIRDNQAKAIDALVAGRADLAHTYLNDARDQQVKTISLIQGIMAQKQATAAATVNARYKQAQINLSAGRLKLSAANFDRLTQGQTFQQKMAQIKEGRLSTTAGFNQKLALKKLEMDAAKAAIAAGQVNIPLSKAKGILYDMTGQPMKDSSGKTISSKALLAGTQVKLPPPATVQKQVENWYYGKNKTTLTEMPKKDAAGNPVYRNVPGGKQGQLSYQAAYRNLRAQHLTDEQARGYLDPLYGRGDRGRPYIGAAQRATLAASGLNVNANILPQYKSKRGGTNWVGPSKLIVSGLPPDVASKVTDRYLTPAQVDALQRAGQLPPGHWAPGSGLKDSRGGSLVRVYLISHLG